MLLSYVAKGARNLLLIPFDTPITRGFIEEDAYVWLIWEKPAHYPRF